MILEDLFELYRDHFLPVYSDFVALALFRPEQVLVEESNILSHIAQFFNPETSEAFRQENLEKARNHLTRVTIDVNKLVWAQIREKVSPFMERGRGRLCFNLPEDQITRLYADFLTEGREARRFEMSHVGDDALKTIECYEKVNAIGLELLNSLDYFKTSMVRRWIRLTGLKPFLLGVLASGLAMAIFPSELHNWLIKSIKIVLTRLGLLPAP
ncbi:MAG: hypothetical protein U5R49_06370 [Deltaproteobacteria bacterium]|nr:hypothetical protein [Deltaproteobacteria bacterium]